MGFLDVGDDILYCEFIMVELTCGDYGPALLWGEFYLVVDFGCHTAEVAGCKKLAGGRGMSISFLLALFFVDFLCL